MKVTNAISASPILRKILWGQIYSPMIINVYHCIHQTVIIWLCPSNSLLYPSIHCFIIFIHQINHSLSQSQWLTLSCLTIFGESNGPLASGSCWCLPLSHAGSNWAKLGTLATDGQQPQIGTIEGPFLVILQILVILCNSALCEAIIEIGDIGVLSQSISWSVFIDDLTLLHKQGKWWQMLYQISY